MILRAVLFDAGNTLVRLEYSRLARAVSEALGVSIAADQLERAGGDAALVLERNDVRDRERAGRYLESLFHLAGVPPTRTERLREILVALHRERHLWSGVDAATPVALRRLRGAGRRLGVVSNSDGRCEESLTTTGLREYFEVVVDSDRLGVEKPDPRIFEAALGALKLEPYEALYVGDIYEVDVVGARRAGLDVILVDPQGHHTGRDVRTARTVAEAADLILNGIGDQRPARAVSS